MPWDKVASEFMSLAKAKPRIAVIVAGAVIICVIVAGIVEIRSKSAPHTSTVQSKGSQNQNSGTNSGTMTQTNK